MLGGAWELPALFLVKNQIAPELINNNAKNIVKRLKISLTLILSFCFLGYFIHFTMHLIIFFYICTNTKLLLSYIIITKKSLYKYKNAP